MIFVKDGKPSETILRVWKVEPQEKFVRGSGSTQETDKSGNKKYSNWNVAYVSKANEKIRSLGIKEKDLIKLTTYKITNTSSKSADGKSRTFCEITVFDFEPFTFGEKKVPTFNKEPVKKEEPVQTATTDSADDLPF